MLKKKRAFKPLFGKRQALEASIAISFVLNFVLILGILYGQTRGFIGAEKANLFGYVKYFLWHFACNIILFYLLFLFNFKVIRARIKAEKVPWWTGAGTLLICFLVSPILSQIQWYALGGGKGLAEDHFLIFNLIKDVILGIIVVLVTRNIYSNYKREQTIIANQRLMEENIRIRFEALKNQLDPHFLFNSLNTLSGLIGIDDEKAHDYVDNLSSVFRYTLQNKNIRTLTEEVEFVESYVTLLKIRYGDNLTVDYNLDERYRDHLIMPVSIQLLVENAVKHNVISNKSPLVINIATTQQGSIMVSNKVNPRAEKSMGAGVGLSNLADRYSILFGKNIVITDYDGVFSVEVPLIYETDKKLMR